jgi:hypothetical protein
VFQVSSGFQFEVSLGFTLGATLVLFSSLPLPQPCRSLATNKGVQFIHLAPLIRHFPAILPCRFTSDYPPLFHRFPID